MFPLTHLLCGPFPLEFRVHGIQFENHCPNSIISLFSKFKTEANYITAHSKNNALLFHGIMEIWKF